MTFAECVDRVSRLVNELLEVLPIEKHDHLEQLAGAIDAFANAMFARGVRVGEMRARANAASDDGE
jgi:hypothetical protein